MFGINGHRVSAAENPDVHPMPLNPMPTTQIVVMIAEQSERRTVAEFVEIGQAGFSCPRCGEPRQVVVEAICRPFAAADTTPWQAALDGVVVGPIHLALRNQPDYHVCGAKPERRPLRLAHVEETS